MHAGPRRESGPCPHLGTELAGLDQFHVPSHLVAVDSASALAQLGKQSSLFYLPSHLVAVDSANALAQLGKQTSLGSCKPGLVWREAYAGDQVCVTTQTRAQAAADNQAAAQRQQRTANASRATSGARPARKITSASRRRRALRSPKTTPQPAHLKL